MIPFLVGCVATAALYTFAPALATVPSRWLRAAWARLRAVAPDDSDDAGA